MIILFRKVIFSHLSFIIVLQKVGYLITCVNVRETALQQHETVGIYKSRGHNKAFNKGGTQKFSFNGSIFIVVGRSIFNSHYYINCPCSTILYIFRYSYSNSCSITVQC